MTVKKKAPLGRAVALMNEINSALGTQMRIGSDPYFRVTRVPTGSLVMDRITGGGFALGRHYELYGAEHACKSYITLRTMALSQARGNICALIDPEHVFDPDWFRHLGGRPKELLLEQPKNAEDAIAIMMMLAKHAENAAIEVVTLDSVASLVPTEEMEKDPREVDKIASQARMMSRALRRITTVNQKTLFLWTNQERMDVSVKFGNPRTTSGGRAMRYYATGRIEFRKGTKVKEKRPVARLGKLIDTDVQVGTWINLRVEKDKSTRPYREGSFIFNNEMRAIDIASEIIQLGLEDGIIDRHPNGRYSYVDLDDKMWKGTERVFSRYLHEDEVLQKEILDVLIDNTYRIDEEWR
jgi:recombination protein RecA